LIAEKPMIAPAPGRGRCDEHGHGSGGLELARERAAEVAATEACRARAQHDQVGAFLGRNSGEPLCAVSEHDPPLRLVADLTRDRLQRPLGTHLPLPRRHALVGARRHAVDNMNEHESQLEPCADRTRQLRCAPAFR
jgi:hypothetical protein